MPPTATAPTILEQKQRRAEVLDELKALAKAAELTGGKFTKEQRDKIAELKAESTTLKTAIEEAEADEASISFIGDLEAELSTTPGRKTGPDKLGGGGGIGNAREAWEDDPNHGFKTHREFLTSIMNAQYTGRLEPRLKSLLSPSKDHLAAGSDEHGEYSDPFGGFFVPKGFSPEVLRVDPEADPLAGRTRQIPMETPSISINARVDKDHSTSVSGGLRVYRRKQTQSVAATRMEHEQVELKANGLFGVAYATEELLARSPISFIALLEGGFSDEFNAKILNERLNGNGTGEFEGMFTSPSKITVTKQNDQPGGSIVKENVDNMRTQAWRYGQCIWLANHGTLPQLKSLVQVVGTGGNQVPYFVQTETQALLDGRPLFFTEYCPALGTEGDLALVNPSQYLEGTLTEPKSDQSMHVRFIQHERTFKFWMENDGRCWWKTPLTPVNGPQQSPIVTLETRS